MSTSQPHPSVENPAGPIEEGECPHCEGTGIVDDDYYIDEHGPFSAEYPCSHCEGYGTCPVDVTNVCACDDCLTLPRDERAGSANAITEES